MEVIVESTKLKVNEIFYSLQGEGARAGEPSIFIRLSGCSAAKACAKSGVVCDTDYEDGEWLSLNDIIDRINCETIMTGQNRYKMNLWIVWTGGEPLDQLTGDVLEYFHNEGFLQAVETSGIKKPPVFGESSRSFDFISLSPKIPEKAILKIWEEYYPSEIRYVRSKGQEIPDTKLQAYDYYISPHSDGNQINKENLDWCIDLCKANPEWKLSVQQHKIWNVR